MIREIVYFTIFLIVLLYVANGNQNENVFLQNRDLVNVFTRRSHLVSGTSFWFHTVNCYLFKSHTINVLFLLSDTPACGYIPMDEV